MSTVDHKHIYFETTEEGIQQLLHNNITLNLWDDKYVSLNVT